MDVVAATLDRMHSWVEVESVPNQGTTVRLTIPLRSIIEHTMVFRAGGQIFALPMQFVRTASGRNGHLPDGGTKMPITHVGNLLGLQDPPTANQLLIIERQRFSSPDEEHGDEFAASSQVAEGSGGVGIFVDEILGPEEVVVRPLPPLFRHQSLYSGVTLSGTGEIMLVLDAPRLIELGYQVTKNRPGDAGGASQRHTKATEKTKQVLIVDDSLSARKSLSIMLRHRGFDAVEASDGVAALERLRDTTYALVVTDLEMPRLSGLELLREIKESDQSAATPVVILSSRQEDEFRSRAERLGVTRYVVKPIDDHTLDEILNELQRKT
jgi:chemosensory pili system protein ChpA (sensor histidine kinase/response regulator)